LPPFQWPKDHLPQKHCGLFTEMTMLAVRSIAVNLAQGFPDFEGPAGILEADVAALHSGENQYSPSAGHNILVQAIAEHQAQFYGLEFDPKAEVTVFCIKKCRLFVTNL
jgi:N-succinyldiaminopimelate aminotransferase